MVVPRELVPQLWIALVSAALMLWLAERLSQHSRFAKHGSVLIGYAALAGILLFLGVAVAWMLDLI